MQSLEKPTATAATGEPAESPTSPRLQRGRDGRLCLLQADGPRPVRPVRCFPWSHPAAYISLRDDDDEEAAFVVDPQALDPASRAALQEDLAQAGFVLHISRILSVRDELEIRTWRVETSEGPRTFQTARDEWPRVLAGGGLLLSDVAGDLYLIPRAAALDPASRRVLWAFTD
jgi:hypothetical protein